MFRLLRKLSDERLLFRPAVIEGLVGAVRELPLLSVFLVPMELPIREVMLGLIRLFVLLVERFVITLLEPLKPKLLLLELLKFKLLLLELLILGVLLLELLLFVIDLLELLLLSVLLVPIELPIREVMLGLIRLLVLLVDLFVIEFRELLLSVFLVPIELPIREVILGLILLFELFDREVEELLCGRVTVLRLVMLLRLDEVEFDEFDRNVN